MRHQHRMSTSICDIGDFLAMALGTPSWLNTEFVEDILRNSEGDSSIHVIDIFTKPATNKGDNYTSDMFRVAVEYSCKHNGRTDTKKRSIIIKVSPIAAGTRQDLITKSRIFETEIIMMTDTLKRMGALLGPEHRLNAKALYVQKEHPTFLVIEDLAALGFRMADRQAGLDLTHSAMAIRALARFHASTIRVCEQDPDHWKLYTKGMFNNDNAVDISGFFTATTRVLATEVSKWPELGPRYGDKIMKYADEIYNKGVHVTRHEKGKFNVINHGDFWVNNMMFRYNAEKKPIDHIFVDFQMSIYSSPAIDLHYFLSTSPSEEVLEHHQEYLLKEYLRTLTNTMKQVGCTTAPITMEGLKQELKERSDFGIIASFAILPFVLVDKSEAKDLDEIIGEDGSFDNPAYKSAIYRRVIAKRIPKFDEQGLLDV